MRMIKAVGLSVLGLSITVAGCSKESNQTQPAQSQSEAGASKAPESSAAAKERNEALVRVVNAVPDAPPIAVTAEKEAAFTDVKPKEVTPYKPIPANASAFAIKPATQETAQPLAENSESIMSGRHYTLVVFPGANTAPKTAEPDQKVSLDVIADDLVPPSPGKARVRVINAAVGTDDVAVHLQGQDDALFSDVDFKEAVAYKDVDPMKTRMELRTSPNALSDVNPKTGARTGEAATPPPSRADRPADAAASQTPGQILDTHSLNLEAGKSYTIVLMGDKAAGHLDTLVVEDVVPQTATATN